MSYVAIITDKDFNRSKQTFDVEGGSISEKIESILKAYNAKNNTCFELEQVSCYADKEIEIKFPFIEMNKSDLKTFIEKTFGPWEEQIIWKDIEVVNKGLDIFYQLSLFRSNDSKKLAKKSIKKTKRK